MMLYCRCIGYRGSDSSVLTFFLFCLIFDVIGYALLASPLCKEVLFVYSNFAGLFLGLFIYSSGVKFDINPHFSIVYAIGS